MADGGHQCCHLSINDRELCDWGPRKIDDYNKLTRQYSNIHKKFTKYNNINVIYLIFAGKVQF